MREPAPVTCRNKHGCDDLDEPLFNQIMMIILTQQINKQKQRERQMDQEEKQEEHCMRFKEQQEQGSMQLSMFQVQIQTS
jgi:tRNA U34 5-carboxymethylaminomethyl modifying GTPase MnmE/TrmE